MKILFIANGDFNINDLNVDLKYFDLVCCVDGGLNSFLKYSNSFPDYIFGDLDSVSNEFLNKCLEKSIVVKKNNQDVSDLLFSLEYCLDNFKNIEEIVLAGTIGGRIDHTLCNIILLNKIPANIKTKIISNNGEIYLVKSNLKIFDVLNKTISLIPLTNIKNLETDGLKWELKNSNIDFGFINGISNIALKNDIEIKLKSGSLLVVINKKI